MAPVLVNADTGLAEDLPQDVADQSVASGTHHIPLNDPEGNPVTAPSDQAQDLLAQGYTQPSPEQLSDLLKYSKYNGTGEQVKAGLEGAASAATFGLSTGIEKALGVKPEEIRGREEVHPGTHQLGEAAGLAASALIPGVGEANILRDAGEGAATALKLGGEGAGLLNRVGASAVKGASEMALLQSGEEVSKAFSEDPHQSAESAIAAAESAIADIGLASLIGAGFSAPFGAISPLWDAAKGSETSQALQDFKNHFTGDAIDPEAQETLNTVKSGGYFSGLTKQKENAKDIVSAATENNWPVLEGMTSASKEVQMGEDSLLNGPPTFDSIQRRKLYGQAYDAVSNSVDNAVQSAEPLSETEVGNKLKQSLTSKLEAENEPIKQLYDQIGEYTKAVPVTDKSTGSISRNIEKIINEESLIKGTPEYNFVKTMSEGIGQVKDLDALKSFRTALGRASGPETKYVSGLIREKLDGLEERAIKRFADTMRAPQAKEKILSLIDQVDQAKGQYREFRGKLQELGSAIGKKKIYGPQDFLDFVENMNPQALTRRLFSENNTEFAQYFSKNFPEEMEVMRQYQRGLIRDSATKEGLLNPKSVIKNVFGSEPEIQKILFSPEELKTLSQAKTYLESFPKQFNPSGTAHESAFRSFFEHPTGAAVGNLRDFAISRFIKAIGNANPEAAGGNLSKIISVLSKSAASNDADPGAFKSAVDFAVASFKGENAINKAAKAIFVQGMDPSSSPIATEDKKREKIKEKIDDMQTDVAKMMNLGGQTGYYLPDHSASMTASATRAIQHLAALKPNTSKKSPLDQDRKPSKSELDHYNRAIDIANRPLSVFQHIKNGTLTSKDIATFKSVYPALYEKCAQKITNEMIDHVSKGKDIPYSTRLGLSLFIGQALDSTMRPESIMSAQQKPQQQPQQQMSPMGHKGSMSKLGKINAMYQTPGQSREMEKLSKG